MPVAGIDISAAMVERMRAKPGGADIPVVIGDIATTRVDGSFTLVYLVFNTIMNLTTQAAQVACFRNAAAHLGPGGSFVIETMLPDLQRLPPGETIRTYDVTDTSWSFDEYDIANQGLISHHFSTVDGAVERLSIPFRYAWPAEFDLMAELAGMRLRDRWSGWRHEPFTSDSRQHVSVWRHRHDHVEWRDVRTRFRSMGARPRGDAAAGRGTAGTPASRSRIRRWRRASMSTPTSGRTLGADWRARSRAT